MAVTKTYPAATIAEAAALGLSSFGENRVQEFAAKSTELEACSELEPRGLHLSGSACI